MKKLTSFAVLTSAFESMATSISSKNESSLKTLKVHFLEEFSVTVGTNPEQSKKMWDLRRKIFQLQRVPSQAAVVAELLKELEGMKEEDSVPYIRLRIVEPIPLLTGTKSYSYGDKKKKFSLANVNEFVMKKHLIDMGVVSYDETDEKGVDKAGNPADVILFRLDNCILEPEPAKYNTFGKLVREPQVTLEILSKDVMQTLGRMDAYARRDAHKARGVFSDEELGF